MKTMKKLLCICLTLCCLLLAACASTSTEPEPENANTPAPSSAVPVETASPEPTPAPTQAPESSQPVSEPSRMESDLIKEENTMLIEVNGHTFTAELADNSSAAALKERLAEGPLTIDMHDYANFEKVGPLGFDLPTNDEQITTGPGDLILYQGNQFTFYYGENSWNFTRLGRVEGYTTEELKAIFGDGDVSMTLSLPDSKSAGEEAPAVYMTADISPEGLQAVYNALNVSPTGKVAVKISTGESQHSNHLRPELIGDLVQSLNGAIVECNTAYGGNRASTAAHKQAAADRGYTAIAEVDIMDEDGSMTLPVTGGDNLTENYVGAHFANYDYFVVLSHFKGHAMAGFGGAIKNISIGIASSEGKAHIHSGGTGGSMWGGDQDAFLESMAEAGKSVVDSLNGNILYINVMNRLSVDCDCDGNPAEPDMHDIGILASLDPVALDQACVDLVYSAEDGQSLINRIESRNGLHTLEQAAKIGLGRREYQLVNIDG